MPLLDEHTGRSDRRPTAWRAWLAAAVGAALLWVVFTFAVSYVTRHRILNAPPGGAAAQIQSQVLADAQQRIAFGDTASATRLVADIDSSRLTLIDKHTYLGLAGDLMVQTGSPAAAARHLDRYLSMSAQLYNGQCNSCHAPPNAVAPNCLDDMTTSDLGPKYVEALRKAHTLTATRNQLVAAWKRRPDDVRLNVLLYHLELARKDNRAALRHADRLKALDKKQASSGG